MPAIMLALSLPLSAQVLYKVEGKNLSAPSYIFGTHHLAPVSVIEEFGALEPFESTAQIVGEIDMTQNQMALAQAMQPHMIAPDDSTLSKVIPADKYATLNEEFKKWSPVQGFDLNMFENMKPMALTTMVSVSIAAEAMPDYDPSQQLDKWFQENGKSKGKAIIPLETAEQQAAILFDTTPIAYQAEALIDLLTNPQEAITMSKDLTDAYLSQDLKKMTELSDKESEHPEFMEALLDRRNADWLTKLPAIIDRGPTFIAVGALHLPGDKGIIEGLRKQGYTVTPVSK